MTEVERANPAARRRAIVLVLCATVAGASLIMLAESQRPALEAWVTADPAQVAARIRLVSIGFGLAFGVPTLLFAGYFWRLGARIVFCDRFPPPGMQVIQDTVVRTGHASRSLGRGLQVLAGLLVLTVVGLAALLWRFAMLIGSRV